MKALSTRTIRLAIIGGVLACVAALALFSFGRAHAQSTGQIYYSGSTSTLYSSWGNGGYGYYGDYDDGCGGYYGCGNNWYDNGNCGCQNYGYSYPYYGGNWYGSNCMVWYWDGYTWSQYSSCGSYGGYGGYSGYGGGYSGGYGYGSGYGSYGGYGGYGGYSGWY